MLLPAYLIKVFVANIMDNYQIETAQNIRIEQPKANLTDRIFAFLIDLLIQGGYFFALFFILGVMGLREGENTILLFMLLGIPPFCYYFLFEWLMNGQTPGKAAMEIRVVMTNGARPGFLSCFIRWVFRLIDITLTTGGVAILCILLNRRGQRLGDLAAGTTVISIKNKYSLKDSLFTETIENHEPLYPQVAILTDQQIREIQDIFQKALRTKNYKAIKLLAHKVEGMLEISSETKPLEFIERVIKDYLYITQR
jgi:uncharacterized RDD family membrane protein YckC